jgi:hypothetical protein
MVMIEHVLSLLTILFSLLPLSFVFTYFSRSEYVEHYSIHVFPFDLILFSYRFESGKLFLLKKKQQKKLF